MSRPVENLWDVAGGPRANGPNVSPILSTEITWSVSQKPCSDAIQEAHSSSVIIQLNEQRISCIFMYTVYHSLPFPAIFHLFIDIFRPILRPMCTVGSTFLDPLRTPWWRPWRRRWSSWRPPWRPRTWRAMRKPWRGWRRDRRRFLWFFLCFFSMVSMVSNSQKPWINMDELWWINYGSTVSKC